MPMKKLGAFFLIIIVCKTAFADHITGGQMSYSFVSTSNGTITYLVSMKLYMRCNSGRQFNDPTYFSIFSKRDNSRLQDVEVPLAKSEIISLTDTDPCITNPPTVCYEVGYYEAKITIPVIGEGYFIAGQVNYRIAGISNLISGYSQIGATYTTEIPGSILGADAIKNNSAVFTGSDLVVVCAKHPFVYSFAADDPDKDSLYYYFCEAYKSSSGPSIGGNLATPPLPPPYDPVPYGNGFTAGTPLGGKVSIDSKTGIISGEAPEAGVYVVTVCVEEFKKGKLVATQRKDLQIAITNCNLTAADLPPEIHICGDTKTATLVNQSASALINEYRWEISNAEGDIIVRTKSATPTVNFPDTGIYSVKLVINPGQRCTDSTNSVVKVYPGFKPAFTYSGVCLNKPTSFADSTTSVYGQVIYWHWNFNNNGANSDTSVIRNASYTFSQNGAYRVILTAADSKGCIDTVSKTVNIIDKPPIDLSFRDTLICPPDTLQLRVQGSGTFVWSPAIELQDSASPAPFVAPLTTTKYYVAVEKDGCMNRDSVLIRVTKDITLNLMNDTTICTGDSALLHLSSNALVYRWTPSTQLNNAMAKQPVTTTRNNITYTVVASISSCRAMGTVSIFTANYSTVNAGKDTLLCYNGMAQLHGITTGSRFRWIPTNGLSDNSILNPIAKPLQTTSYVLEASDEEGCPKPVYDTVIIAVLPQINATVTNDTSLIVGQQIQLVASGGTRYLWQPSGGLSNNNIPNPIASFGEPAELLRYQVDVYNDAGCYDSAFISIKVYRTEPTVFVPSGFTPNGDGKNDYLRPIAVGMKHIERFVIFNRYGQQVFFTTTNGDGWDGRINGQLQETGAYVWMVQAIDYKGRHYTSKGTVTLIR